jgi:hypothetical protein
MSQDAPSLIAPPDQQDLLPETLPDGTAMWSYQRGHGLFSKPGGEAVGEYTGERFFQTRPGEYKLVVRLLASGVGILTTAAIMRVSPNTVIAVRNREGVSIKAEKQHLSRLAHVFSNVAFEGAAELLTEILADPARRGEASFKEVADLIKAATAATSTGQLLAGEATGRVDIPDGKKPGHDAYVAELEQLRDVTSTGLGGEKDGALRDGPGSVPDAATALPGDRPDAQTQVAPDDKSVGQPTETP